MNKKSIQIDDTADALKELPSILNTAIVTPHNSILFTMKTYSKEKCRGVLEIKIGDFSCYLPKMMMHNNKTKLITKIKDIVSKKFCSLNKKKKWLKETTQKSYRYIMDDYMEEVAINIYSSMSKKEKNSKDGLSLKEYLISREEKIFGAILLGEEIELLNLYLDLQISDSEILLATLETLDRHAATIKNYIEMKSYILQALNMRSEITHDDFDL